MSLTNDESVSKIVEKYWTEFPNLERRFLRRLILAENKNINSRTLDRHLQKLFKQSKQEHEKSPEKSPKLSPEEQVRLNLALVEFRKRYQNGFDEIAKTYLSSPEKAWKKLREFAATWPEPARCNFLSIVAEHMPKKDDKRWWGFESPIYFVNVLDTFKISVWKAVLNSDKPWIH